MPHISVNQFRDNLKHYAELATKNHEVITVSRRNGEDIVIMSAEDWSGIEETFFVLQNTQLMSQIQHSIDTHTKGQGHHLSPEETNEINRF